ITASTGWGSAAPMDAGTPSWTRRATSPGAIARRRAGIARTWPLTGGVNAPTESDGSGHPAGILLDEAEPPVEPASSIVAGFGLEEDRGDPPSLDVLEQGRHQRRA